MMKAAKNWCGDDAVLATNPMTVQHRRSTAAIGKTPPEAHVRTPVIVVRHPLAEDVPEVTLVQRNHPVQALTSHRANHPLAERIGLWRSHRRLEDRLAPSPRSCDQDRRSRCCRGSCITNRYGASADITSRNCGTVQAVVGCSVTFQCTIRRVPTSRTTNTYPTRNVAVTTPKKSHASTDRA